MEKIEETVDIKDIDTQCDLSLAVSNTQKAYFDEMVIFEKDKDLHNFSFSKNLGDIETAIYARTGSNLCLKRCDMEAF